MKLLICVSLVMSSIGLLVEGNMLGAPAGACDSLSPNPTAHGAQPQTSDVPYTISLMPFYNANDSSFTYYPGRTYTCKLRISCTESSVLLVNCINSELNASLHAVWYSAAGCSWCRYLKKASTFAFSFCSGDH